MYDYIACVYGIRPAVGQSVWLRNYPPGKVAPEDPSQSHYVMVRFENWDHDTPCHPTDLEFRVEISQARLIAAAAALEKAWSENPSLPPIEFTSAELEALVRPVLEAR